MYNKVAVCFRYFLKFIHKRCIIHQKVQRSGSSIPEILYTQAFESFAAVGLSVGFFKSAMVATVAQPFALPFPTRQARADGAADGIG